MRGLVHVTSLVELLHMRLVTERRSAMARDVLTDPPYNLTSPLIPPNHGRHKVKVFLQPPCHVKKHVLCQPGSAHDKVVVPLETRMCVLQRRRMWCWFDCGIWVQPLSTKSSHSHRATSRTPAMRWQECSGSRHPRRMAVGHGRDADTIAVHI